MRTLNHGLMRPLLVTTAAICILLPACRDVIREAFTLPPGTPYWMVVVHEEQFLPFIAHVRNQPNEFLPLPSGGCKWKSVAEFDEFVDSEVCPHSWVVIFALEPDDPSIAAMHKNLLDRNLSVTIAYTALSEWEHNPDALEFRESILALKNER